jgi:hypothetical protein
VRGLKTRLLRLILATTGALTVAGIDVCPSVADLLVFYDRV